MFCGAIEWILFRKTHLSRRPKRHVGVVDSACVDHGYRSAWPPTMRRIIPSLLL